MFQSHFGEACQMQSKDGRCLLKIWMHTGQCRQQCIYIFILAQRQNDNSAIREYENTTVRPTDVYHRGPHETVRHLQCNCRCRWSIPSLSTPYTQVTANYQKILLLLIVRIVSQLINQKSYPTSLWSLDLKSSYLYKEKCLTNIIYPRKG